jgi:hypothetical protein
VLYNLYVELCALIEQKIYYLTVCNGNGNLTELGLKPRPILNSVWKWFEPQVVEILKNRYQVQTRSSIKGKTIKLKLDQRFLLKSRIKQH